MDAEYERMRDFLILHYHVNDRIGEPLWDYTRRMAIPDSLAHRLDLFRARGYIPYYKTGLFAKDSWLSVLLGQGVMPRASDPLTGERHFQTVEARMRDLRTRIVGGWRPCQGAPGMCRQGLPGAPRRRRGARGWLTPY